MKLARLVVIGIYLRVRDALHRLITWVIEPAEARELDRWRVKAHDEAMGQMNVNINADVVRATENLAKAQRQMHQVRRRA